MSYFTCMAVKITGFPCQMHKSDPCVSQSWCLPDCPPVGRWLCAEPTLGIRLVSCCSQQGYRAPVPYPRLRLPNEELWRVQHPDRLRP